MVVQVSEKVVAGEEAVIGDVNLLGGNLNLRVEAQSTPDMTVLVKAGVAVILGKIVNNSTDTNSPAFTAPGSNNRIDLLVMDIENTFTVVQGTSAVTPVAPELPPDKDLIALVYLRSGATSIKDTDDTTNGYIYQDLRSAVSDSLPLSRTPQPQSGEAFDSLSALYIKQSDGKVYKTDADDAETSNNFVGFAHQEATGADEAISLLTPNQVISGFTDLTAGTWYFLAKTGTGEDDQTISTKNGNSNAEFGKADQGHRGGTIVTTEVGFLNKITLSLKKVGAPDGNIIVRIRGGAPDDYQDSPVIGSGAVLAEQTMVANSLTSSFADTDFTFNLRIPIGKIWVEVYHDGTQSDYHHLVMEGDVGNDANCWFCGTGTNTWHDGVNSPYFAFDFEPTVFAAGDITTWFYDIKKTIGRALSTAILLCETNSVDSISGVETFNSASATGVYDITHNLGKPPKALRINVAAGNQDASGEERGIVFAVANEVLATGGTCWNFRDAADPYLSTDAVVYLRATTPNAGFVAQLGVLDETTASLTILLNDITSGDYLYLFWEVVA